MYKGLNRDLKVKNGFKKKKKMFRHFSKRGVLEGTGEMKQPRTPPDT